MEQGNNYDPCAFDTLFGRSVPHILEKIFFSLDYKSFKNCMEVNKQWRELLSTASYQKETEKMLIEKEKYEEKLFIAVQNIQTEEVRSLISSRNVDVNFKCIVNTTSIVFHSTPLFEAAAKGHNEIVQILLDSGADIDKGDCFGTPLWYSAYCGHTNVVKTLVDRGADLNKADMFGSTPLCIAAKNGRHLPSNYSLMEVQKLTRQICKYGRTPLHCAVQNGRLEVIKILLEGGADPDRKDWCGNTLLQLAQRLGYKAIVKHLLKRQILMVGRRMATKLINGKML